MKKVWVSYCVTVVLASVLLAIIAWIGMPLFKKPISIKSPLPEFLSLTNNQQVTTLDIWAPILEVLQGQFEGVPTIHAKAALVYDVTTGKTLYAKNPEERLPMASLTKIMTAIIALEHKREDDQYVVWQEDLVGENSMGLSAGEILTLEELLYGLILVSGNDAAETLARNFPTGRSGFIQAMNDKAKALGLTNIHFTNPSGLQGDGEQYASAADLLVITKYALSRFSLFRNVAATVEYTIPYSVKHKAFPLYNETNLLTSYPGVKGVKTGYTPEAGLCLVTYLEYKGHKIIGILLGSNNRRQEMKDLLDYSLKSLGVKPPKHS